MLYSRLDLLGEYHTVHVIVLGVIVPGTPSAWYLQHVMQLPVCTPVCDRVSYAMIVHITYVMMS